MLAESPTWLSPAPARHRRAERLAEQRWAVAHPSAAAMSVVAGVVLGVCMADAAAALVRCLLLVVLASTLAHRSHGAARRHRPR